MMIVSMLLLVILAICPGAAALGPPLSSSGGAGRAGVHRISHQSFVGDSSNSKHLVVEDQKRLEPQVEYRASTSIPAMLVAMVPKQAINLLWEALQWASIVAPVCFFVHFLPFASYFPSVATEHIPMMKLGVVTGIIMIAIIVPDDATETSNAWISSSGKNSNGLVTCSEKLSNAMITSSGKLSYGMITSSKYVAAAMVVAALISLEGVKKGR